MDMSESCIMGLTKASNTVWGPNSSKGSQAVFSDIPRIPDQNEASLTTIRVENNTRREVFHLNKCTNNATSFVSLAKTYSLND